MPPDPEGKKTPDRSKNPPAGCRSERATSPTLLQRIRAQDPEAWNRLVQLYTPLVFYWCGQWGCRRENWEDVSQEVFLAVSASMANFRKDRPGDSFRAWLRGVTRNTLLMFYRRDGRQPQATGGSDAYHHLQEVPANVDADDDPPQEVNALHRRALEMVRGEFEDRTWQMFWRSAIEGRSPVDIAAELNVTPAAVRMAKSRILRRLKIEFDGLI